VTLHQGDYSVIKLKGVININTRAEKCSGQSRYSHYGSYATA